MKFKSTLVGLFALVLVAGAATLTYYSYISKQSKASASLPVAQNIESPATQATGPIYKATPVFIKQNPSNNMLFNGENELYSFSLGTQLTKSITFKQIALKVQKSSDVKLSNFKLYRNGRAVPSQDYDVMDGSTGLDLKSGVNTSTNTYLIAVVALKGEDVIYGAGNTYSVKAMAFGDLLKKSYVMTSAYRLGAGIVTKGYLTNVVAQPFTAASQNIYSIKTTADLNAASPGFFIWSDKSAARHTPSVTNLSSGDWFSDYDDGSLEAQPTTIATK